MYNVHVFLKCAYTASLFSKGQCDVYTLYIHVVTFRLAELSSEVAGLRLAGEASFSPSVSFLTRSILPIKLDMSIVFNISTIPSFFLSPSFSVPLSAGLVLLPRLVCLPVWRLAEVA